MSPALGSGFFPGTTEIPGKPLAFEICTYDRRPGKHSLLSTAVCNIVKCVRVCNENNIYGTAIVLLF